MRPSKQHDNLYRSDVEVFKHSISRHLSTGRPDQCEPLEKSPMAKLAIR